MIERVILAAMVSAAVAGCARPAFAFRPAEVRRVEGDGFTLELERADIAPDFSGPMTHASVFVRVMGADEQGRVIGAWLVPEETAPCTGAVVAVSGGYGLLDAAPLPVRLRAGRRVRLDFVGQELVAELPGEGSVLDVRVERDGGSACLRVPFTAREGRHPWRPASNWFAGFGARNHAFLRRTPFDAGSAFVMPIGYWPRPSTRIWIEPGVGPINGPGEGLAFFGLHVEQVLAHRGSFAVGVSAGYSAWTAREGFGAPEFSVVHGPELALRLKLVPPTQLGTSGFPGSPQLGGYDLAVPLQLLLGSGAQTRVIGLSSGFILSFDLP